MRQVEDADDRIVIGVRVGAGDHLMADDRTRGQVGVAPVATVFQAAGLVTDGRCRVCAQCATALTQSVWPTRTACCCPVTGSQTPTTGRRRTVGESRLGQTLPQRKLDTQRLFGLSYLVRQVAIYEQCSEGVSGLNKASSGVGQVGVRVGDSGR